MNDGRCSVLTVGIELLCHVEEHGIETKEEKETILNLVQYDFFFKWRHNSNTNRGNQILKRVPERVCFGIWHDKF